MWFSTESLSNFNGHVHVLIQKMWQSEYANDSRSAESQRWRRAMRDISLVPMMKIGASHLSHDHVVSMFWQ